MALNLNSIMLGSADFQKLGDFYKAVLQKEPEMNDPEHSFIGFVAGSCFLSICAHDKVTGPSSNPERILLFFETTEVEAEFDRIKDIPGATVVRAPYKPDPNGTAVIATLADADGNYFQLNTPWNA